MSTTTSPSSKDSMRCFIQKCELFIIEAHCCFLIAATLDFVQTLNPVVIATEGLEQAWFHKSRKQVFSALGEIWEIWLRRHVVVIGGLQLWSRTRWPCCPWFAMYLFSLIYFDLIDPVIADILGHAGKFTKWWLRRHRGCRLHPLNFLWKTGWTSRFYCHKLD